MKPPERRAAAGAPRRVLLIGWDAADWRMIDPLIDAGLMPTLKRLVDGGVRGNLASLRPMLSPMLWNTIATGKLPDQHGVLGFTEPDAQGTNIQPVSSTSRRCKALWNMATHCGLNSNVVGWYASHPAEPIAGVMVSNQFEHLRSTLAEAKAPPAGSLHPEAMLDELSAMRVAPAEVDAMAILPFVPDAHRVLQQPENRLGKLQTMLAQTSSIHAIATHLMQQTDWDLTTIYYEGIDRFGHEFMHCHPPKMDQVAQEEFEAYQHCMVGTYRFHDMLLETLLTLAGDDTAVVLISDHGYYHDHRRPDPTEGAAGPTDWHRPFGVFAATGPGFSSGNQVYGANLLDVAPTVLQLLGLPPAYDMPGRVLAEVLDAPELVPRIESWEEIEGNCGMHPAEMRVDPVESREMLQQLIDLGYVEPPDEDTEKTVRDTIAGNQSQLAQSLMDSGQYAKALEVFDGMDDAYCQAPVMQLFRANCLIAMNERQQAREVLQQLLGRDDSPTRADMMLGVLEFAEGNTGKALEHLQRVAEADPRLPGLHTKLGEVYLETEKLDLAEAAFQKALDIDPDSPPALAGLARVKLEKGDHQSALDYGLQTAELVHYFPRVHYVIGRALLAQDDPTGAIEALQLCVKQAPSMRKAHLALASAFRACGKMAEAKTSDLHAQGVLQYNPQD